MGISEGQIMSNFIATLHASSRLHCTVTATVLVTGILLATHEARLCASDPLRPKSTNNTGPLLTSDLATVPEVSLLEPLTKEAMSKAADGLWQTWEKILQMDQKKTDAFMHLLLVKRADLAGLPFTLGDACRMNPERGHRFQAALGTFRQALQAQASFGNIAGSGSGSRPGSATASTTVAQIAGASHAKAAEEFWEKYGQTAHNEDLAAARPGNSTNDDLIRARLAALQQIIGPESPSMRTGMVKFLGRVQHAEATRALAKLAIFSAEEEVRGPALVALKIRRDKDYTDILQQGLRYPYPAVVQRTSEAMIYLERHDLVGELVSLLDEPDPRLPIRKEMNGKKVPLVRELVRVNHLRNCLLCHPPVVRDQVKRDVTTGAIPIPGRLLPDSVVYYKDPTPDIFVRADVTYLRQDFSLMQPVAGAHSWPETQRFDFLVRSRVLSTEEAKLYTEALMPRERGALSPYQRAVLEALRGLTGRNAAPTAEAWRLMLELKQKG
jgi:hypothetical protein